MREYLSERADMGLSPPTRGNLTDGNLRLIANGSIPAHAGEPSRARRARSRRRVYPRPRGGTVTGNAADTGLIGLSPPTRGNPTGNSVA